MNGNNDISHSPDNTDDDIIKGHIINMSEELTGELRHDDPIGSPAVALKRDVKRPGYWSHMTDCTCSRCRDLVCVALDMKYFMLQVGSLFVNEKIQETY